MLAPIGTREWKVEVFTSAGVMVVNVFIFLQIKIKVNQVIQPSYSTNLLSKVQSGFRPLHSTMTALFEASSEWFTNIDDGLVNSVVFLDFDKLWTIEF